MRLLAVLVKLVPLLGGCVREHVLMPDGSVQEQWNWRCAGSGRAACEAESTVGPVGPLELAEVVTLVSFAVVSGFGRPPSRSGTRCPPTTLSAACSGSPYPQASTLEARWHLGIPSGFSGGRVPIGQLE
jgi:hypothetical protein